MMMGNYGEYLMALLVICSGIQQLIPDWFEDFVTNLVNKLLSYFKPTVFIRFDEFTTGLCKRSYAFTAIESYLSSKSSSTVDNLKADSFKKGEPLVFSAIEHVKVEDEFEGVKVKWWRGTHKTEKRMILTNNSDNSNPKCYYTLQFHRKHREIVTERYLKYVLEEGKAIKKKRRRRSIYMNDPDEGCWCSAPLEHPASFDTLAMDSKKKDEIMTDLVTFSHGKEYYKTIGRAWKRGYLLYGPPGTGKSTMIVAMSNLLGYDIYDLELTSVKDNAQLKSLLILTSPKAIIVVEDIDRSLNSLDQICKREEDDDDDGDRKEIIKSRRQRDESKLTMSGFLNFVDGIWSACGGERIIVFTTNHVHKLDPALIREGRMDVHLELSYCTFQGFEILARNYLKIDSHPLFENIRNLLGKVNVTPCKVAEQLILRRVGVEGDPTSRLMSLIKLLETKLEEEAVIRAKAEEAKAKQEEENQALVTKAKGRSYGRSRQGLTSRQGRRKFT